MKASRTRETVGVEPLQPELPRNYEAERNILAAILVDLSSPNTTLRNLMEQQHLRAGDFFHDDYRSIFTGMAGLNGRGLTIEETVLVDELRATGELKAVIYGLADGMPRINQHQQWARIVKGLSIRRRLIRVTHDNYRLALNTEQDVSAIIENTRANIAELATVIQSQTNGSLFDTRDEFEQAADATFSIKGFLQDYAVTAIAALSGDCKTWVSLNIARALLFGPGKLWELFEVSERAKKIVYLIPEVSRSTLKPRLIATKLYDEVDKRFFIRTLTKGPALPLTDPNILREVEGAHVVCDTAIRFMKAVDENSASEAAAALSDDCFTLLRAGALTVIPLFHAPKAFVNQTMMSKEAMIRGSGEFGASIATAWGLRKIDPATTTVHIENIKDRDFQSCQPFQLIGRPYLDQEGEFRLHARNCGKLAEYLDMPGRNKGGAPSEAREAKAAKVALLDGWLKEDANLTSDAVSERFKEHGMDVKPVTVRRYKQELKK